MTPDSHVEEQVNTLLRNGHLEDLAVLWSHLRHLQSKKIKGELFDGIEQYRSAKKLTEWCQLGPHRGSLYLLQPNTIGCSSFLSIYEDQTILINEVFVSSELPLVEAWVRRRLLASG